VIQYILSLGQYFLPKTNPGEKPYYNVLPQFVDKVIPGGDKIEWTADCFKTNQAWAQINQDNSVTLNVLKKGSKIITDTIYLNYFNNIIQ
jgi:hypothetical protein